MSEAPDQHQQPACKTTTLGEELWRVHVNRYSESSPEDFDHEAESAFHHKPPSDRSIGEELWLVHCKRSAGALLDEEEQEEEAVETKRAAKPEPAVKAADASKIIHLRNRDVKISQ